MNKYLLSLSFTLVFINARGQSTPDSVAIIKLLEKEAATWRAGDIKAHADCWQMRPYSRILVSTGDGRAMDIPPSMMLNPPASLAGNGGHAVLSNFAMRIHSDNAWVSHDEVSVSKDGKEAYTEISRSIGQ
jgi:hypothetical protein